jgi:septin 3/9/12
MFILVVIEENGVKLKLNVIDTPGFGDQINNDFCWEPISRYVKDQYAIYLRKELSPQREKRIVDTRVHALLYFVAPTGHSLKPLDLLVMKKLGEITNLVIVIGKSDSLTMQERVAFKDRVKEELQFHGIQTFGATNILDDLDLDPSERDSLLGFKSMMPFALVGSEMVGEDGGRCRQYKWGRINIDDPNQCDFTPLRDFLIRQHLQVFLDATGMHYESFRTKQLMALKEASKAQQA